MKLQVGVKILLENDQEQYLFLRRSQSIENGTDNFWDIPGGRIEIDEVLSDALVREIHEETGLRAKAVRLLEAQDIFSTEKDIHVVRLTYVGEVEDGQVELSDEHAEYCWMTKDNALSRSIDPYVAKVIGLL